MDNSDLVSVKLSTLVGLAPFSKAINLRHRRIRSLQSGGYLSPFKGRGMEFEEVRPYQSGDDIRSIDWKVTARTDKPHTKIFREERERPVFISVDNRKTMHFATRGVFKSVQAAKLAGLIAWAAKNHGDRVGGQLFSDNYCQEIKPQNGKHGVLRFLNTLVNPATTPAHEFSFERVLSRLQHHIKPGSLIYLVSDFRGMSANTEAYMTKLARHCQVVLIFIYDPLEKALPEQGRYRFTDHQRDVVIDSSDTQKLSSYQQRFEIHYQKLEALAKKLGLLLIQCDTTADPLECLR
ncbi:MAG: DUF58 domain-containing protein [Methylococcales bacterium]|nr:DUF58 domain-containing protein [Methylococcales bacterium]